MKNTSNNEIKRFYTKENNKVLEEIRTELKNGRPVQVVNEWETFYGCSFDDWLRNGLSDINCDIKVLSFNHFPDCGYPWEYEIMPK